MSVIARPEEKVLAVAAREDAEDSRTTLEDAED